jgi:hypothetical protein
MSRRQTVLLCLAFALVAVLAVQRFWPRDEGPEPIVPKSLGSGNETSPGKVDAQPADTPPSGRRTAGARLSYPELFAISQRPRPEDLSALRRAVKSPSWEHRQAAVVGIGRLEDKGDPQSLQSVLTDTNERPEVRAAAAEALGAMRYIDAGPDLIDAMSDPSELVRAAAGVAVSKIMGMRFEFSARDPAGKREEAVELARKFWPKFYPELKRMQSRKR